MSKDIQDVTPPAGVEPDEVDRRGFLAGFGKAGMVALPFAAAMLSSRDAVAQSGAVSSFTGQTGSSRP